MKPGKHICETLKSIRKDIAQANDIDYNPVECTHQGDCAGTCPACESEMRWLERQLRHRHSLGKAVIIAGLSLALSGVATATPSTVPSDRKKNVKHIRTHKHKKNADTNNRLVDAVGYVDEESFSNYPHAEFPNGQQALADSIGKNIKIPEELFGSSDETIVVQFSVLKDCSIGEIKIFRSKNPAIDKYIIDAIRKLPKFSEPGYDANGNPITTWFTLPINLKGKDSE